MRVAIEAAHQPVDKHQGPTNSIERFNNMLRQQVTRLACKALSFSKKIENHVGAITISDKTGLSVAEIHAMRSGSEVH